MAFVPTILPAVLWVMPSDPSLRYESVQGEKCKLRLPNLDVEGNCFEPLID